MAKQKILLIDHSTRSRTLITRSLIRWGYEVRVADSSVKLLSLLDSGDALNLDLDLVIINNDPAEHDAGFLTRALKQHPDLQHLPIIILFHTADQVAAELALQQGADLIMQHPKRRRQLRVHITDLLTAPASPQPANTTAHFFAPRTAAVAAGGLALFCAGIIVGVSVSQSLTSKIARPGSNVEITASTAYPPRQDQTEADANTTTAMVTMATAMTPPQPNRPALASMTTRRLQETFDDVIPRTTGSPTRVADLLKTATAQPVAVTDATVVPAKLEASTVTQARELTLKEIHFSTGVSQLSPGAQVKTRQAAEQILNDPEISKIKLYAFSDTIGSAAANLRTSEHRARAVADLLVKNGVRRDLIEILNNGESNLPFTTADGVDEPENRCVGIKVMTTYQATPQMAGMELR